jgi:molybdopterin converting factor small subunit
VNVTVRYHGIVGDMLRRKTQQVEIPDGATVTDLLAIVSGDDEGAQAILKQTRAFIDGKQADRTMPLADGAEVTFMRPIAGGAGCASEGGSRFAASGGAGRSAPAGGGVRCADSGGEEERGVEADPSSCSFTP